MSKNNNSRVYALLNILSLSVGIAASIIIFLYVNFELSYDNFNKKSDRLFRLNTYYYRNGVLESKAATCPAPLASILKEKLPEVSDYCRLLKIVRIVVSSSHDKQFRSDDLYFAGKSFFLLFDFPIIKGSPSLSEPNTIVLTRKKAIKLFGTIDVIGKTVRIKSKYYNYLCKITGVVDNIPKNSHLHFDGLVSMKTYTDGFQNYGDINRWNNKSFFYSYILTSNIVDKNSLNNKIKDIVNKQSNSENNQDSIAVKVQNIRNIHLCDEQFNYYHGNESKLKIYILIFVALLIIVLSLINYNNISISINESRFKEVAIRKVYGATKINLIYQFIKNSLKINSICILIALLIVVLSKNIIKFTYKKDIPGIFSQNSTFYIAIFLLLIIGTIISSVYPLIVLANFSPLSYLDSRKKASGKFFNLRTLLTAFQFIIAFVMISSIIIIKKQTNYMQNKDLGFNPDNILVVRAPVPNSNNEYSANINSLRSELEQNTNIVNISGSTYIPGQEIRLLEKISLENEDVNINAALMETDDEFFKTLGIKLIAGRDFSKDYGDDGNSIILNGSCVNSLRFNPTEIIGKEINLFNTKFKIIGVIKDYNQNNLESKIGPIAFILGRKVKNYYLFKLKNNNTKENLRIVKNVWKSIFPDDPFDYFLLKDFYDSQNRAQYIFRSSMNLYTFITLVISGIGLLALVIYSLRKRIKEIAIRKMLGISISELVLVLLKDYFELIATGIIIGIPLTIYFMNMWLNTFAYHIRIGILPFLISILIMMFIIVATLSYEIFKAVTLNPIDNIRRE